MNTVLVLPALCEHSARVASSVWTQCSPILVVYQYLHNLFVIVCIKTTAIYGIEYWSEVVLSA